MTVSSAEKLGDFRTCTPFYLLPSWFVYSWYKFQTSVARMNGTYLHPLRIRNNQQNTYIQCSAIAYLHARMYRRSPTMQGSTYITPSEPYHAVLLPNCICRRQSCVASPCTALHCILTLSEKSDRAQITSHLHARHESFLRHTFKGSSARMQRHIIV